MPGSHHLVALTGEIEVGMVSGVITETICKIIRMWVDPIARGRGVGSALVAGVERWALGAGVEALHLSVSEGNEAAAALYRRCGFEDVGKRCMVKQFDR